MSVRRLFLFVEESSDKETHWVVFEPNDERSWPTNDAGRHQQERPICVVGVALVKPAKFVIFRIQN
jgi:phage tail sheath protein FI